MTTNSFKHSWNWTFDKSNWCIFSSNESLREIEPTFLDGSRSPIKILSTDGSNVLAVGIKLENDKKKADISLISSFNETSFGRFNKVFLDTPDHKFALTIRMVHRHI